MTQAIDDIIRKRRTVHIYKDTEIPQEEVMACLELALLAPNHKHTYPWSFVVVGMETRRQLVALATEGKASKQEKASTKILNPGALVAFCCKRSDDPKQAREDYASVAAAIQNYSLSMMAKGYYSKWSTGKLSSREETYEILGVDAKTQEIVGFIWAGEPMVRIPEQKRPEFAATVKVLP